MIVACGKIDDGIAEPISGMLCPMKEDWTEYFVQNSEAFLHTLRLF